MTRSGGPPNVFVIDDDDAKLASALAKLAESAGFLRPPTHARRPGSHGCAASWREPKKTCRQEIFI